MYIEEDDPVRLTLICETCTYRNGKSSDGYLNTYYYSWNDLLEHAKKEHWTRTTMASNGQWRYLCQYCDYEFQASANPVVDFACNLYCGINCARRAYEDRLTTHDTLALLAQEKRDLEYVIKSLKGEA